MRGRSSRVTHQPARRGYPVYSFPLLLTPSLPLHTEEPRALDWWIEHINSAPPIPRMTSQSARHAYAPQFYICQRGECQVTRETFICEKIVRQHCKNRTPYALRARSLLRVLGHAGAVVLRAAVSHTSYALVPRLGVDIPFTHSPKPSRQAFRSIVGFDKLTIACALRWLAVHSRRPATKYFA